MDSCNNMNWAASLVMDKLDSQIRLTCFLLVDTLAWLSAKKTSRPSAAYYSYCQKVDGDIQNELASEGDLQCRYQAYLNKVPD